MVPPSGSAVGIVPERSADARGDSCVPLPRGRRCGVDRPPGCWEAPAGGHWSRTVLCQGASTPRACAQADPLAPPGGHLRA